MPHSVSRGLLSTEARSSRGLQPSDPEDAAARAFERLTDPSVTPYEWKEKAQWARRLARGDADFYGRRLFSDAGRSDARYVARVAGRAYRGEPPEGKAQLGHLRESLLRIYEELAEGPGII